MKGNSVPIDKDTLLEMYYQKNMSMQQVASSFGCSLNKIDYWMRKYGIVRRTRSDAAYAHSHPDGDPFTVRTDLSPDERELFGIGIGLYWGEGTKASPTSVRIGNSDPGVILKFMHFLECIYGVNRGDLRFGMQLFSDCSYSEAMHHWLSALGVGKHQFYRPTRTQSGRIGTYRRKNRYGVVTLYYNNKRLRDILVGHISDMPR